MVRIVVNKFSANENTEDSDGSSDQEDGDEYSSSIGSKHKPSSKAEHLKEKNKNIKFNMTMTSISYITTNYVDQTKPNQTGIK